MDSINEKLDNLSELSQEELQNLDSEIRTQFDTLKKSAGDEPNEEDVAAVRDLVAASKTINAELSARAEKAAEMAQIMDEASAHFATNDEKDNEDAAPADDAEVDSVAVEEVAPDVADSLPTEEADAEAPADAEDTPAEEATETPEEESQEDAGTDEEDKKDEELSTEVEEASEPVVEAETFEAEEAPAPVEEEVKEETEDFAVETETVAEAAVEAEAVAELAAEELSTNETENVSELSAETTTTITESEEGTMASNTNEELSIQAPAEYQPSSVAKAVAPTTITAGADLPGIPMGTEFTNLLEVAQALLDRRKGMGHTSGGDNEHHTVATFTTSFPDNLTLFRNDDEGNKAKINAVVDPSAIVAAGGLTAPVETSYDIFELGETAARPVRDALPRFGADRGGIRFMTAPTIADLNGAVGLWTLQDDIDAATPGAPDPVKPCLRVNPGTEVTVYTDAITLCLTFGNLGARAYPELVERHTQLGMVSHARFAETRLLTRLGTLSTKVSAPAALGAARDIFVQIEQAAAAYRSRYRLDPNAPLRAVFPEWFKNALRADLTKQLPGDGQDVTFNLAEAQINQWFSSRNINTTWHIDGEAGQIFGAQADGSLLNFPANVIWYIFSEGTFLFLDGGTLDLGLVRDSTLNGTNDYKIFLETFEGLAKVGIESLRVTSALKILGASTGTVAPA